MTSPTRRNKRLAVCQAVGTGEVKKECDSDNGRRDNGVDLIRQGCATSVHLLAVSDKLRYETPS